MSGACYVLMRSIRLSKSLLYYASKLTSTKTVETSRFSYVKKKLCTLCEFHIKSKEEAAYSHLLH